MRQIVPLYMQATLLRQIVATLHNLPQGGTAGERGADPDKAP